MIREYPLSEAKTQFPKIIKGVELREEEVVVTRNGRPAAVIINYDEFHRLKETVDVLTDRFLMAQIRKSRAYFKKKPKKNQSRLGFEDVFDEPLK